MVNGSWASVEGGGAEGAVELSGLSCGAASSGSAVEGGVVEPVAAVDAPAAEMVGGAMTCWRARWTCLITDVGRVMSWP